MHSFDMGDVVGHNSRRPCFTDASWTFSRLENPAGNARCVAIHSDGAKILLKICRDPGGVPEICKREYLCSMLGVGFGLSVVQSWCVPVPSKIESQLSSDANIIRSECVAMEQLPGRNVGDCLQSSDSASRQTICKQVSEIESLLVFAYWLGDEDRGLGDVMLSDGQIVFIDFGLSGPGNHKSRRGAHPHGGYYKPIDLVRMCVKGKLSFAGLVMEQLKLPISHEPQMVEFIEGLKPDDCGELSASRGLIAGLRRV
jgi:hypothetical protein